MLINGKSDNITEDDILEVAKKVRIKKSDAIKIIKQIKNSVSKWSVFAREAEISEHNSKKINEILNAN